MCDYSLENVKSRAAVDGEDLVVKRFISGSKGFASADDLTCAVCCKPGVEMTCQLSGEFWTSTATEERKDRRTTVFTGETPFVFHTLPQMTQGGYKDGLVTSTGRFLSLQDLPEGTRATVIKALPKEIADAAHTFDADIKLEMVPDYTPAPVPALVG